MKKLLILFCTTFFLFTACNPLPQSEADIQLHFTTDKAFYKDNEIIQFHAKIINNGPQDATNIQSRLRVQNGCVDIITPLPDGYSINGIWAIDSLMANDTLYLSLFGLTSIPEILVAKSINQSFYLMETDIQDPVVSNNYYQITYGISH